MADLLWLLNPVVAFVVGILLSFNLRKIAARVQSRRGPLLWMPAHWMSRAGGISVSMMLVATAAQSPLSAQAMPTSRRVATT